MTLRIDGPRILPVKGKAEQLVVLCHGYGADGNDLIGLAPYFQELMPNAVFVAPNAPMRCDMSPYGYQWFPISRMNPEETLKGVQAAAPILESFIADELKRHELDGTRLALVGFSQGTMMSLHVGLRRAQTPAAILGFSGALVGRQLLAGETTSRPPILLVHGDRDEMIPLSALHKAVEALSEAGLAVQWHVSPGVGHGIDPTGLTLGATFLADAFAGRLKVAGIAGPEAGSPSTPS